MVTQEFDVSAEELLRSLKRRGIPLPSEIGAFITLEACEHVLDRPALLSTEDVAISGIGEVLCADGLAAASQAEAVRALMVLLGELLVCAAPGVPSMLLDLVERGPSQREPTLAGLLGDLEACLLPLNRGATRRVLARLVRETRKAGPSMRASSRPAPAELDAQFDALMSGAEAGRRAAAPAAARGVQTKPALADEQPRRPLAPLAPKGSLAGAAASAFAAPGASVARARAPEPEPETRPKSPWPENVERTKPAAAASAAAAAAILRARGSDGPQPAAASAQERAAGEPAPRPWPPSANAQGRAVVRGPSGSLPAGAAGTPSASAAAPPSAAGVAARGASPPSAAEEDDAGRERGANRDTARALPRKDAERGGARNLARDERAGFGARDADGDEDAAAAARAPGEGGARAGRGEQEGRGAWFASEDASAERGAARAARGEGGGEHAGRGEREDRGRDDEARDDGDEAHAGAFGGSERDRDEARGKSIRDAADRAAARARQARRNAGAEHASSLRGEPEGPGDRSAAQATVDLDFVNDEAEPTLKRNMKSLQAGAASPEPARRSRSPALAAPELADLDELAEARAARGRLGLWIFGLSTVGALALLAIYFAFGRDNARHALGLDAKSQLPEAPKPTAPARPAVGDLSITSQPGRAQVLLLIGPGPALATDLPLGVAQEFVAIAEGYAPARAVVPADATWEDANGQARYELAIQADRAKSQLAKEQLGATLLPRDVGTPQARLGSVRIVTTPRGAKVYQLIGFTPDVRVENLPLDQSYELLIYLDGRPLVMHHVAASDFREQGGKRVAEISIAFDAKK